MQCIYNYIPETKHVSRVFSIAAILELQFMAHVISHAEYFVLLHQYFWKYVCSIQHGCCCWLLLLVLLLVVVVAAAGAEQYSVLL